MDFSISQVTTFSSDETVDHSNKELENLSDIKIDQPQNQIKSMILSNNLISSIDSSFLEHFPNLVSINLSNNKLENIQNLQSLTNLKDIDFSSNNVSDLIDLTPCKNIERINASYNSIKSVTFNTINDAFQKVDYLDLRANEISRTDFGRCFPALRTLKMDNNKLQKVEQISDFKSLEVFSASSNEIHEFPRFNNSSLRTVSLSNNHIKSLSNLSSSLSILDVSGNPINDSGISQIKTMKSLRHLFLTDTLITKCSLLARPFPCLTVLILTGTKLSNLNDLLSFVKSMRKLQVLDTRFTPLTESIYSHDASQNPPYHALEVYNTKYPENSENRIKYRKIVIDSVRSRIQILDHIILGGDLEKSLKDENDLISEEEEYNLNDDIDDSFYQEGEISHHASEVSENIDNILHEGISEEEEEIHEELFINKFNIIEDDDEEENIEVSTHGSTTEEIEKLNNFLKEEEEFREKSEVSQSQLSNIDTPSLDSDHNSTVEEETQIETPIEKIDSVHSIKIKSSEENYSSSGQFIHKIEGDTSINLFEEEEDNNENPIEVHNMNFSNENEALVQGEINKSFKPNNSIHKDTENDHLTASQIVAQTLNENGKTNEKNIKNSFDFINKSVQAEINSICKERDQRLNEKRKQIRILKKENQLLEKEIDELKKRRDEIRKNHPKLMEKLEKMNWKHNLDKLILNNNVKEKELSNERIKESKEINEKNKLANPIQKTRKGENEEGKNTNSIKNKTKLKENQKKNQQNTENKDNIDKQFNSEIVSQRKNKNDSLNRNTHEERIVSKKPRKHDIINEEKKSRKNDIPIEEKKKNKDKKICEKNVKKDESISLKQKKNDKKSSKSHKPGNIEHDDKHTINSTHETKSKPKTSHRNEEIAPSKHSKKCSDHIKNAASEKIIQKEASTPNSYENVIQLIDGLLAENKHLGGNISKTIDQARNNIPQNFNTQKSSKSPNKITNSKQEFMESDDKSNHTIKSTSKLSIKSHSSHKSPSPIKGKEHSQLKSFLQSSAILEKNDSIPEELRDYAEQKIINIFKSPEYIPLKEKSDETKYIHIWISKGFPSPITINNISKNNDYRRIYESVRQLKNMELFILFNFNEFSIDNLDDDREFYKKLNFYYKGMSSYLTICVIDLGVTKRVSKKPSKVDMQKIAGQGYNSICYDKNGQQCYSIFDKIRVVPLYTVLYTI
ncbi:hypothetical protein TRFO_09707 [Tritrichomonas foetus]|uniref:Leucine Rich Repeat family protein n=1 Tax=Tritrichomonas foetus TaxID=1144522 RepID=A0A1J4JCB0_9EUKA|nr:hypothetical protein TRFO_09707 [Tritrichomonas foetus]|eukprot:OHS96822.1 hypothetical protein TRFO_09707 [Tritrichomonas foetus]